MCGIAGIITKNGAVPDEVQLRSMSASVAHRGPDGEGIWLQPGVGFAHRRLSIIDLSPRGRQPMHDSRVEITIVFNGEIYNYRELKRNLMLIGNPTATPKLSSKDIESGEMTS